MKTHTLVVGSFVVGAVTSGYLSKSITEGEIASLLANNHVTEARLYARVQELLSNSEYGSALAILSSLEDGARIAVREDIKTIDDNLITRYMYSSSIKIPKEYISSASNQ